MAIIAFELLLIVAASKAEPAEGTTAIADGVEYSYSFMLPQIANPPPKLDAVFRSL